MLSLLLVQLTLAQAEPMRAPVAVVLTSKRPGADAAAEAISRRVVEVLTREGVAGVMNNAATMKALKKAGFKEPRSCQGEKSCVSQLAVLLGPKAVVVGVDVGRVGKSLAIHLEAVAADKEASLDTLDVASSLSGWSSAMAAPIVVFGRNVKAGLALPASATAARPSSPPPTPLEEPTAPPVTQADAPVKTNLTPEPTADESPVIIARAPEKPPRVAAWVLAGGAAAAAGAAVGLGIWGGSARSSWEASLVQLPGGGQGTTLPRAEAERLAGEANGGTAAAVGAGVVSAGLTAAAMYFFLKD